MQTLYEKYRPRALSDVLGQEKASTKVRLLLERGWGGRAWRVSCGKPCRWSFGGVLFGTVAETV